MLPQLLADYVLALSDSLGRTHRAEDRPLYERYLAESAVLLALAVRGTASEALATRVAQHERLWGQTFLVGLEHQVPAAIWQRVRAAL